EPTTQIRVLRPGQNVDPDVASQLSSCAFRVETPTASSRESGTDAPSLGAYGLNCARINPRQPTPCSYGTVRRLGIDVERGVAGHAPLNAVSRVARISRGAATRVVVESRVDPIRAPSTSRPDVCAPARAI